MYYSVLITLERFISLLYLILSFLYKKTRSMDQGQQTNELCGIIYKLVNEVESLKKVIAELGQENNSLKQELEKYRTPKNSSNSSKPPWSDFPRIIE